MKKELATTTRAHARSELLDVELMKHTCTEADSQPGLDPADSARRAKAGAGGERGRRVRARSGALARRATRAARARPLVLRVLSVLGMRFEHIGSYWYDDTTNQHSSTDSMTNLTSQKLR